MLPPTGSNVFFIIQGKKDRFGQLKQFSVRGIWSISMAGQIFWGQLKQSFNGGSCWNLWVRKHAGLLSCIDLDLRCQPHPHRRINPHKRLNWVCCMSAVPQWNGSDWTCTWLHVCAVHRMVINEVEILISETAKTQIFIAFTSGTVYFMICLENSLTLANQRCNFLLYGLSYSHVLIGQQNGWWHIAYATNPFISKTLSTANVNKCFIYFYLMKKIIITSFTEQY